MLPSPERTSALGELSFLLTAAGQFQIFTGFPFQPLTSLGCASNNLTVTAI
jgi:hypothetical protein